MRLVEHSRAALAGALADRVAGELAASIAQAGRASIAVPGGTTPGPFLEAVSMASIDWSTVSITLTDERCVAPDHPRSNAGLVCRSLVDRVGARFVPLFDPSADIASELHAILPLNVCVLGMGADMHTASLFPDAVGLDHALNGPPGVAPITALGADEPRVSLTAGTLTAASNVHVLITGPDKRDALERAMQTSDTRVAPIRAILDAVPDLTVWYAD